MSINNIIEPKQRFGALIVRKYILQKQAWKCLCDCGKICFRNSTGLLRVKHPSCGCQRNIKSTLPDNLSLKRAVVLAYRTNAAKKGLVFDLKEEDIFDLIFKDCYYCGVAPSNCLKTRKRKGRIYRPERDQELIYNGIDRIDSKVGYIKSNCVPCCCICNISKNDMSLEEWQGWLSRIFSKTFNDYAKAVEPSGSKRKTPEKKGEDIV